MFGEISKEQCKIIDLTYRKAMKSDNRHAAIIKCNIEKLEVIIDRYNTEIRYTFSGQDELIEKFTIDQSKGSLLRSTLVSIWYYTVEDTYKFVDTIPAATKYLEKKKNAFIRDKMVKGHVMGMVKILDVIMTYYNNVINTYLFKHKKVYGK